MNLLKIIILILISCIFLNCKEDKVYAHDPMDESLTEKEAYFNDYEASEMKFGYINTKGELVIMDKYDGVREFSEGLAAVNYQGQWGYIDVNGRTVIDFTYRSAFAFHDGIARVQDFDQKYWYVDRTGKVLNQQGLTLAYDSSDGLARIKLDKGYNFISMSGDTLLDESYQGARDFEYGLAVIKNFGYYGVISTTGDFVIPASYNKINVDPTTIRVKQNNQYILFNHLGERINKIAYASCSPYQSGRAVVSLNGILSMISDEGKILYALDPVIKRAEPANSKLWRVFTDQGTAIMNEQGIIISDYYEEIFNYSGDRAGYLSNEKWGFLDLKGQEIIPAAYDLIWDFKDGRARVVTQGGIGFIDPFGSLVIPPVFFEVKDFDEGRARVQIYRG